MRLVNLTKRVMVNGGLRYCPVVEAANGRIRPDVVMVDGEEERHPEGSYYIDYREGEKRERLTVGKNAADAQTARLAKQAELNAVKAGLEILDAPVMIGGQAKHSLAAAIASYLEDVKLSKKPKTYSAYSTALTYFAESCRKQFVEDIDRRDMLKFSAFLRDDKDQSPRSVYNKFESVMAFLKLQGMTSRRNEHGVVVPLVNKNDWPRFTEEEPEVYEREEITKFLNACEPNERLWFEFFLMTGMREQEVMYTYWSDINFAKCTVRVSHKPDRDWTPKAYKEREIPVPESLIASLKRLKAGHGNCNLVFATFGCKPKMDFLDCCKAVAKRAKLNPETFWLHKFRATFATWALWKQVDLKTVQSYLGHSDMESTMRYLKPAGHDHVREKMNSVFEGVSQ
jgi:integrase/recombinase XerD